MFGWNNDWEKQEGKKDRRSRDRGRTISGGIKGVYSYKDKAGGEHIGLKGSARIDGKLVTDKNEFRKSEEYQTASRRRKDQMSKDFNRGVDLTEAEQKTILKRDEDGNVRQKDSTYGYTGTTDERGEVIEKSSKYLQKLMDMTAAKDEVEASLVKQNEKFNDEQQEKQDLQNEADKKKAEEEDDEGKPRPSSNDDTNEGYNIEDAVAAEVDASNPFVRRSHINNTLDQEVMQLLSEIEALGGAV